MDSLGFANGEVRPLAPQFAHRDGRAIESAPPRFRPVWRRIALPLFGFVLLCAFPASADWQENWGAMIWGEGAEVPDVPSLGPGSLIILTLLLITMATRPWKRRRVSTTTSSAVQQCELSRPRPSDDDRDLRTQIASLRVQIAELQRARAPIWRRLLVYLSNSPRARSILMLILIAVPAVSYGGAVGLPYIFTNGTPADANQVNENFATLADESNAQDTRIGSTEAAIVVLESAIIGLDNLISAQAGDLSGVLSMFSGVTRNGSDLVFSGMNVQIVDGSNSTDGPSNGVGNLIVGYNENYVLATRTGSHNLILGVNNDYNSYGGLVSGELNKISAPFATISGGLSNEASGSHSSVLGGEGNLTGLFGETKLGSSPDLRLIDVTNPPPACSTCTAAVGDGVSGDAAGINEAMVYACDNGYDGIFLPEGTYRIGGDSEGDFYSGMMIEASSCPNGIAIIGAGIDRTTLLPSSPTGQYLIASCDDFSAGRYGGVCNRTGVPNDDFVLRIANLRIFDDDIGAHSQSIEESHGIGILHTGGTTLIERILIENVGDEGIDVSTDQGRVVIRDSRFVDPRSGAIAIYQSKSVLVENVEALMSASNPGSGYGIDIDTGSQDWVVENVEIRNSSFLGSWAIGIHVNANSTGLSGTTVRNIAIQNNEIETNPTASRCAAASTKCGSIYVASGDSNQYVRDVLIAHNQLQGSIHVSGDSIERIRIIDNTIVPAPQISSFGLYIRGLGSEVISNHITGFTRGCIQFESTPTNGGANSTIRMKIADNYLSCLSGYQGTEDAMIGHVGSALLPPAADDEGYFEITNNHISIEAGASIKKGIVVVTPFKNVRVRGNVIKRPVSIDISGSYGIMAAGNPLMVEGNIIDGFWSGIYVGNTTHGKLTGNELALHDRPFSRGFEINDSSNVLVTDNIIHGAAAVGASAARTSGTGDRVICMNNISMGVGGVGRGGIFSCGDATSTVGLGCNGSGVGGDSICDVNIVGS